MPLPCMRQNDMAFEHETALVLDNPDGTENRYDCRIQFSVAFDDTVTVHQVDVWGGSRWQDAARVEDAATAGRLLDKANDIDLFDTVSVLVEDRRAEQARHDHELRIDNADDRGHALRERIAERMEN